MYETSNPSTETNLQAAARRAAKRVGLQARKSRSRTISSDNRGEFMLVDPMRNCVIAGERFDLSAQEVIDFCEAPDQRLRWRN